MKENFYVFLNIDSALIDASYDIEKTEKDKVKFNTEGAEALKFLLEKLGDYFDVNLVISSVWRLDMAKTINKLYENNLLNVKKVEATKASTYDIRGLEIKEYLKDKANKNNYLVIDSETKDIASFLDKKRIMKIPTEENLKKEQINKFLIEKSILKEEKTEIILKPNKLELEP